MMPYCSIVNPKLPFKSPNSLSTNDCLGNVFEREIFQIINRQIADKFDAGVRIFQTPTGPDGGNFSAFNRKY